MPPAMCASFGRSVADALTQARRLTEVDMTPEAWQLWEEKYESLVTRPRGLVGTLTARATPMVRRFALLYALMDERSNVHVRASRGSAGTVAICGGKLPMGVR